MYHTASFPSLHDLQQRRIHSLTAGTSRLVDNDNDNGKAKTMCQAMMKNHTANHDDALLIGQNVPSSSVSCWSGGGASPSAKQQNSDNAADFDLIKVEPFQVPTGAVESLVIVIPPPSKDDSIASSSATHLYVLELIDRLLSRPWLAKTILIVCPHDDGSYMEKKETNVENETNLDMQMLVEQFLQIYYNESPVVSSRKGGDDKNSINRHQDVSVILPPILPLSYTKFHIRQLIVLDVHLIETSTSSQNQIYLLPQGKKGLLPNLDLLAAAQKSFDSNSNAKLRMHPFDMSLWEEKIVKGFSSRWLKKWGEDLGHLGAFMTSMIIGPYGAHSSALHRGIDSMTIKAEIKHDSRTHNSSSIMSNLFQSTEHLIRGLSSLSEKLHHSVNQYLLPSTSTFVSHGEYVYPVILLLLPNVIRAVSLAMQKIDRYDFQYTFCVLTGVIMASSSILFIRAIIPAATEDASILNTVLFLVYMITITCFKRRDRRYRRHHQEQEDDSSNWKEKRKLQQQSLQFMACVISIYLHVPLILSHVSLAFISILLSTPFLSFPCYQDYYHDNASIVRKVLALIVLIGTWPPILITKLSGMMTMMMMTTPNPHNDCYSIYVCIIYIPLHLMLTILWLC